MIRGNLLQVPIDCLDYFECVRLFFSISDSKIISFDKNFPFNSKMCLSLTKNKLFRLLMNMFVDQWVFSFQWI